ncbi:hypothetical protein [Spirosoma sp.]|uniref:hypothetical protein n=1 Tax=Spirosoma sp. TaxID=1899569 RepID=UPI0026281296|nr:hypothetical protein [Spirosoma sp.]MCX6217583.1 hypothetical protein [Spirosoma sp.]
MNTEAMPTDEMTLDAVPTKEQPNQLAKTPVENALIAFDITQLKIQQLRDEEAKYVISGPDDKRGAEVVNDFRLMVMRQRTSVEKKAKELKAPHIRYNKEVDAASNALTEQLEAIEDRAKLKLKLHRDEVERIETEKMLANQRRTEARHKELVGYGYVFNAALEAYEHDGDFINFDDMKQLSDEEYEPIVTHAQTAHRIKQEKLAEEAAAETERVRLKAIADQEAAEELARQQAKLKEDQDALKAQQDELANQCLKLRVARLLDLGFLKDGRYYTIQDYPTYFSEDYLMELSSEAFGESVNAYINWKKDRDNQLEFAKEQKEKEQAEQERQNKVLAERSPLLEVVGFTDNIGSFAHPLQKLLYADEVATMDEDTFAYLIKYTKDKNKQADDEAKAKRLADKARTARLAPDKKELKKWATALLNTKNPAVNEPEVYDASQAFLVKLRSLTQTFIDQIDAL